ncbi:ribosome recycling factor [Clavulina sp. PMI_390]|nr:ribosome recycling factor [Clavulina sp. PMI_390]
MNTTLLARVARSPARYIASRRWVASSSTSMLSRASLLAVNASPRMSSPPTLSNPSSLAPLSRGKKTKADSKKGRASSSASEEEEAANTTVDWPPLFADLESKMSASYSHFAKEMAVLENRASGRVNASLLDAVRVPNEDGSAKLRLNEVATVGVKEGNTLLITLFDDKMLRKVEQAIFAQKIPGAIPQIVNETTIKIPISKPTMESRQAFVKDMAKLSETTRVTIRGFREAVLKTVRAIQKTPIDKSSTEAKKLQTITDKFIKQIDDLLKKTQTSLERL